MAANISTFRRRIITGHRIEIPRRLDVGWSKRRPITWLPLIWQRPLDLPHERRLEAWLLCDLHADPPSSEGKPVQGWRVDPREVLERLLDDGAADLATLIFEQNLEGRSGQWRLVIPDGIRDMDWLPREGNHIVLRQDEDGVSVWREETYQIYLSRLGENW